MARRAATLPLLSLLLMVVLSSAAAAQVATLASPAPEDEASAAPAGGPDGEEAILELVACLRENGLDLPDPQFGPDGPRFADPAVLAAIDFASPEFLDAMEACADLLAALQPELDPEQQAEQVEQQVAFAECMRREGIDFPDPDPVRGYSIADMRAEDGSLVIDPFSAEFQAASEICVPEVGVTLPGSDETERSP